jgi:hypothetical protein
MKATKRHAIRRAAAAKPRIEFPQEGEHLAADIYTMRVAAPDARSVSVAIDQGPWMEARHAVGYWWFDWTGMNKGEHEVIACAEYEGGREAVSESVHCFLP